ncbi:MAG: VOC family protein [Patescibacteria group bacterium]|nr:VOC family protein [Patescibacteria group bacterium]
MLNKYKIFLFSETPDKLVKFYNETLGFRIKNTLKLPKDYGYNVLANDEYEIWIAEHSEVKGYNKDPYRHIITFYVDKLDYWWDKVKNAKEIKIEQEPVNMSEFNPKETRRVFTVFDPEGNCLQFIGN